MKIHVVILLPLVFLTVACSSAKERTLTVGMPLEHAVVALASAHAHETELEMRLPGAGKELKCFELPDGRLVCLVAQRRPDSNDKTVIEISVCGDSDKPKAQRTWARTQVLKL
jgi:hypothetical protein